MLDFNVLISGLLSGVIGALAMYVIAKKVSKNIISELIEEHFNLKTLQNDEELMKFVFMLGGLLGKGARGGIGMDKKLNVKQVGLNMLMDWGQQRGGGGGNQTQRPQNRQPEENPLRI